MPHWRDFLDVDGRCGRFLPWKEVARSTGLSRTTAWRLQKRDDFPAPYAISPGRVGYREEEVEAWRVSRGPSAARPRTAPDVGPAAPVAVPPPGQVTSPVNATPAAQSRPDAMRDDPMGGPAQVEPPARIRPEALRVRPRRRSEHAKAIAQQMRFDF
jgi:predicted DNA-binding transcriptional regulator AlpA